MSGGPAKGPAKGPDCHRMLDSRRTLQYKWGLMTMRTFLRLGLALIVSTPFAATAEMDTGCQWRFDAALRLQSTA